MDAGRQLGPWVNTGQVIGRGSFATVFKGYKSGTQPPLEVAIKAMYPEKIKQKQLLQEREVEVMRSLRHPNVVELLDVLFRGEEGSSRAPTVYMVFEYCAGGDLAAYLRNQPGRKLSEERTRHWMSHLKDGLMFLRSKDIVHRDLKPQNLLLSSKDDSTALLKLADFGFARFIHNQSLIETVCGTPLYMAPEILRSEKYSVRSDLWSVGCIIFQCLVGRAPFVVRTHYELIMKLESEPIVVPADVRAQISPDCYALLMALLTKEEPRRLSWENFFRHPWFGGVVEATGAPPGASPPLPRPAPAVAAALVGSGLSLSALDDSSIAPAADNNIDNDNNNNNNIGGGGGGIGAMAATRDGGGDEDYGNGNNATTSNAADKGSAGAGANLTVAAVMGRHETASRLQRVTDRALAVLELADMKMDHSKPDEACVLFWRGLECLTAASAAIRADKEAGPSSSLHDSLLERLRIKHRVYQDRATRAISAKRHPATHARPPSELLFEFALQMGRDGGVSEILRDFPKANKLYANGAVILELLLSLADDNNDRAVLVDALQRFATRIAHVRAQIAEEDAARSSD